MTDLTNATEDRLSTGGATAGDFAGRIARRENERYGLHSQHLNEMWVMKPRNAVTISASQMLSRNKKTNSKRCARSSRKKSTSSF